MRQREKVVPRAAGTVLEVGIGTGLNLPFYRSAGVNRLIGLDPSAEMRARARKAAAAISVDVELLDLEDGAIPLADGTVDTVVVTYTLCTIPEPAPALRDMRRVMKPEGRLLFCEHGVAPDPGIRRWQRRLHPLWMRLGGGCYLSRAIPDIVTGGGFRILELQSGYIPGFRPASFNYWGVATPG